MKSNRSFAVLLVTALAAVPWTPAAAGLAYVWQVSMDQAAEVSLYILPDGSGPPLTQAMAFGGQTRDARIDLLVTAENGDPVAFFPMWDVWLAAETDTDFPCPTWRVFFADGHSDLEGQISFSAPFAGGGWSAGPTWIYLQGSRSAHPATGEFPPVSLRFNSADIDASGQVDLADVVLFARDFHEAYHYRSDFHWDGVLDLADVARMASGLGRTCQ